MENKQLYLCLVNFKGPTGDVVKFIGGAIASNERDAEAFAIEQGVEQYGDHLRNWAVVADVYSLRRDVLEQAAREVLGWNGPQA